LSPCSRPCSLLFTGNTTVRGVLLSNQTGLIVLLTTLKALPPHSVRWKFKCSFWPISPTWSRPLTTLSRGLRSAALALSAGNFVEMQNLVTLAFQLRSSVAMQNLCPDSDVFNQNLHFY
jgi:hypothetical protein